MSDPVDSGPEPTSPDPHLWSPVVEKVFVSKIACHINSISCNRKNFSDKDVLHEGPESVIFDRENEALVLEVSKLQFCC